jgi:tetratricopeptide (TPR) repeat protein
MTTPAYARSAWGGRVFDLRVEDHPEPLVELRRLLKINRAYNLMNAGDEHMTNGDIESAVAAYGSAEALAPDNHEMVFWHAVTLAGAGALEQALPLFARAFDMWPKWREFVPRLPASGLLPDDQALLDAILSAD